MRLRRAVGALCTTGVVLAGMAIVSPRQAAADEHQGWITEVGVVCVECCFTGWCCDVPQNCGG